MNDAEIQRRIDAVPYWWHTIKLGNLVTLGRVPLNFQDWVAQVIPRDLIGKSVLDIGAWDGYFSFLAEQRGASRVVAIDKLVDHNAAGFMTAKEILNSKVEFIQMDVLDLDKLREEFDVVFFFGVFYHLMHPLLALEKIYEKTKSLLLIETHVVSNQLPLMVFYEKDEYEGDSSNWWGPSVECVMAMCRSCGFARVEMVDKIWGDGRALFKAYK